MAHAIDYEPDVAVGITLPLKNGSMGYFDVSFTTLEQAKSNLKNLLLTNKGERPMQPDFGSEFYRLLFEPIDDDFSVKVDDVIRRDMGFWLPYLNVDSVVVKFDPIGTGADKLSGRTRIDVAVRFSLKSDIEEFETLTFVAVHSGE